MTRPCIWWWSRCLSSLLTRPDMEERPLQLFLSGAVHELRSWSGQVSAPLFGPAYCSMLGRVTCLAQLFKRGHRQRLLPVSYTYIHMYVCIHIFTQSKLLLAQHASSVLLPCVAISSDSRSLQVFSPELC